MSTKTPTYSTKTYAAAFGVGALLMALGLFAFTQLRDTRSDSASTDAAVASDMLSSVETVRASDMLSSVETVRAGEAMTIPAGRKIVVYKSASCGCCKSWIAYLEKAGYEVEAVDESDMAMVKAKYGIPRNVQSCHTGIIDGYVVEGHVPVEDIERLLAARPEVAGIAAPGMPVGSPGMEQGGQKDPYDVVAFRSSGEVAIFASYNK